MRVGELRTQEWRCSVCAKITSRWEIVCRNCNARASFVRIRSSLDSLQDRIILLGERDTAVEERIVSNVSPWDAMTGGGIPRGTVTLMAGDGGTGKSTLTLEIASRASCGKTLLISGEEIVSRIDARAQRIGVDDLNRTTQRCRVLHTTSTEDVFAAVSQIRPSLVVVDSVQAFVAFDRPDLRGVAGSPSQIKLLTLQAVSHARRYNVAWILVGQVNEDGKIAGPHKMKHWVDAVCELRRDERSGLRYMKFIKSRYCETHQRVQLVMTARGLVAPDDPRSGTKDGKDQGTQEMSAAKRKTSTQRSSATKTAQGSSRRRSQKT